jgi:hypothetical protein
VPEEFCREYYRQKNDFFSGKNSFPISFGANITSAVRRDILSDRGGVTFGKIALVPVRISQCRRACLTEVSELIGIERPSDSA